MKKNSFKGYNKSLIKRQITIIGIAVVALLLLWLFVNEALKYIAVNYLLYKVNSTFVNTLRYKTGMIFLLLGFITIIVIWFVSQTRLIKDMSALIEAVENINTESGLIKLPNELAETEIALNTIRERSCVDREQAREAEQRKNDLVAYLAHDLRTPLTSVIGYLSLLNNEQDISAHSRSRFTEIALRKAYRIEDLTNELFDITCYNLHEMNLSPVMCNITVMLMQLLEEFAPIADEHNLKIIDNIQNDIMVECDVDKIARVFDNLMKNACAYSADGGTITLRASQNTNSTVIYVQNQGKQIPEYKLKTIFDKFTRLDASRSSRTGGTGLGLAIAREIVSLHNGEIRAESNVQFTKFTVTLPNKFGGSI